jgi:hypothetical protein
VLTSEDFRRTGYIEYPCRKCAVDDHHSDHLLFLNFTGKVEQTALSLLAFERIFHAASTAKRAGIEGTVAQAMRTCEMRRARYLGSKKLRLQAFFTATAINILRACAWLADGTRASTLISRFARLVATAKSATAA